MQIAQLHRGLMARYERRTTSVSQTMHPAEPTFGRALTDQEWTGYQTTIEQAKKALGKDCLGLISPIRSLPTEVDTGMGNLLSAKPFLQFIRKLGFDLLQVDPDGKTKPVDASPYVATVFSSSPLQIDLSTLANDPAWGGILKPETVQNVIKGNPNAGQNKVAYAYICQAQTDALHEAFQGFKAKIRDKQKLPPGEAQVIEGLKQRFEKFGQDNVAWLKPDALYEALTLEYNNDYWPVWQGPNAELDKNLMNPADPIAAQKRTDELLKKYQDVVEEYIFVQFVAHEQKQAIKQLAKTHNLALMADRQIGFSDRDVWAYQSLFLPGYALGAPPDYFSKSGQAWGFPVLDPAKLFNADGTLGEGGKLLERLCEKILEDYPQGFRKDHAIGDIDPWVYPANISNTKPENGGARLFSSPDKFPQFSRITPDDIKPGEASDSEDWILPEAMTPDKTAAYAQILDKIVLPALKKRGLPESAIIFEDLGTLTTPVKTVLKERQLSGIRVTQFVDPHNEKHLYRGKNVETRHWITPGTHDNKPTLKWLKEDVMKDPQQFEQHAKNLAEDIIADANQRPQAVQTWTNNPLAFLKAKYTELFTSPARNVQLFFTDWLGLEDTYNTPGTSGDKNWALRIPHNYEQVYFEQLKADTAVNIPEVLAMAMEAKGNDFVQQNQTLVNALKSYAQKMKS